MPHAEDTSNEIGVPDVRDWSLGVVIVGAARLSRRASGSFEHWLIRSLVACTIAVGVIACEDKPEEPSAAKPVSASAQSGLLRLTHEESSRMELELAPVARGQLLAH